MGSFGLSVFASIARPFRWLAGHFDSEDLLFYLGLGVLWYGIRQISEPYAYIIAGGLLILHAYIPGLMDTVSLFARAKKAARTRK